MKRKWRKLVWTEDKSANKRRDKPKERKFKRRKPYSSINEGSSFKEFKCPICDKIHYSTEVLCVKCKDNQSYKPILKVIVDYYEAEFQKNLARINKIARSFEELIRNSNEISGMGVIFNPDLIYYYKKFISNKSISAQTERNFLYEKKAYGSEMNNLITQLCHKRDAAIYKAQRQSINIYNEIYSDYYDTSKEFNEEMINGKGKSLIKDVKRLLQRHYLIFLEIKELKKLINKIENTQIVPYFYNCSIDFLELKYLNIYKDYTEILFLEYGMLFKPNELIDPPLKLIRKINNERYLKLGKVNRKVKIVCEKCHYEFFYIYKGGPHRKLCPVCSDWTIKFPLEDENTYSRIIKDSI